MKTYLPYKAEGWHTEPISPVCTRIVGGSAAEPEFCHNATSYAYPAWGGGWQALCDFCARPHFPLIKAFTIEAVILSGETFEGHMSEELAKPVVCECGHELSEHELEQGFSVNEKIVCEKCWEEATDFHDEV